MKTLIARSFTLAIVLAAIAGCSTQRDNSADGGSASSYHSASPVDQHGPAPRNAP